MKILPTIITDEFLSQLKKYVFLFNTVWVLLVLIFVKSYDMRFAAVNCLFELLFFYWLGVYIDWPYNNEKEKNKNFVFWLFIWHILFAFEILWVYLRQY